MDMSNAHDRDNAMNLGSIVYYCLGADDAEKLNKFPSMNHMKEGMILPAVIVRCWDGKLYNLKVMADGEGECWLGSREDAGVVPEPYMFTRKYYGEGKADE